MAIRLGDDGSLDTLLVCDVCGEEARYNFASSDEEIYPADADGYDQFIENCMTDMEEEHECS